MLSALTQTTLSRNRNDHHSRFLYTRADVGRHSCRGICRIQGAPEEFRPRNVLDLLRGGRNWSGILFTVSHRMDQAGTLKFLVSEFLGYLALFALRCFHGLWRFRFHVS